MKINTGGNQYIRGDTYGFSKTVKIHNTANIIGNFTCGENCRIDGNVTITGKVTLGRNVHIATGAKLFGANGIFIGDHSGIGDGSTLLTSTDDPHADLIAMHAENELETAAIKGPIIIGNYVLICSHCVILPNVQISDEVILGALSMVNGKSYLSTGRVYAGIPAQEISSRPKLRYTK
jgi:acetyltransferase-like isoleucine patch superfamily enzyme